MRNPLADRPRLIRVVAIVVSALVVLLVAFVGVSLATDQPGFCNTCHEMTPYYSAWQKSPHDENWCITCHVGPTMPARLGHKFVALKELYSHLTGDNRFPRPIAPEVPSERCRRCHATVKMSNPDPGFSHAEHESFARCQQCHPSVGHRVTADALRQAGVLDAETAAARSRSVIPTGAVAALAAGSANIKGHLRVACERCHNMAATGCPACHESPAREHEFGNECTSCHKPGAKWAFFHPSDRDCKKCHKPPREEHAFGSNCRVCHRAAKSWAFFHPSDRDCKKCHQPPRTGHAFGKNCRACHRPAESWAFFHTGDPNCRNCHSAPKNHFGSNCAACHSPGTPFQNATFNHPGVGEEHSYRSFACSKCHPSGPPAVSCTCHGGRPPTEEEGD